MEAAKKRNIQSGEGYTHLFPKAEVGTKTIRRDAGVSDTVNFIPKVVRETLEHTRRIAPMLKGKDTYETCSKIWQFVYRHIAYKKDEEGYEQIRSPARAWHDRKEGVDCDCYSVFISSILTNLGIPHLLRITKYHRDYFQHIYPVVPYQGSTITIDCVTDQFDFEVPYSAKKDYPMELQYLNGFESDGMGELGRVLRRKMGAPKARRSAKPKSQRPKKKGFFKKLISKVNKFNPATILLRNGVLASMKLNVKNVAKRLRWSYLTQEQAAAKGIDPAKFQRLVATREKLERIFSGAGGKVANLKKAILKGKGNRDKAVAGLGEVPIYGIEYMNTGTPLPQLLGPEVYHSENVEGFEGFGALGEPITLASIAAAAGVISGIVAALKQIGDIFPKKTKESEDFDPARNEAAEAGAPVPDTTPVPPVEAPGLPGGGGAAEEGFVRNSNAPNYATPQRSRQRSENDDGGGGGYPTPAAPPSAPDEGPGMPAVAAGSPPTTDPPAPPEKEGFWDKNKSWMKPVAIGVGGLTLVAIGFAVLKPKHTAQPTRAAPGNKGLSGVPKRQKSKNHQRSYKHKKRRAVALL
jgi:hypothetical protein